MDLSRRMITTLRYLVFADPDRTKMVAAFAHEGEARSYLHAHFPITGCVIDLCDAAQINNADA